MPTRKEPFQTRGTLRGEGGERTCSVEGVRIKVYVDELAEPVKVMLDTARVADGDSLPDGAYELTFDGETLPVTRRNGSYYARRK